MFCTGKTGGWVVGLLLLQCQAGPAPSAWVRVSTPDLELLTSGDARVATAAVAELDGLRSDWAASAPTALTAEANLRIVAFSSEAEYQPFRINAFSPAYFVGGAGQDTIVLGRMAKENFPALRHEFVHHLIRARWRRLPLWLEEGLADYFGGVDSGAAQARTERLRRGGLLPLTELAQVVKGSTAYQDREAALQFYAESWALTHLLMTSPAYRTEAWAFVARLNDGESLESAAEWVFGRNLPQLQADLKAQLGRLKSNPAVARAALNAVVASAAASDDVSLVLARLLLRKGDTGAAQRYLDRLAESSRSNPELWSLTGDLALKQGRTVDARFALQEAMRLGSRDSRGLKQLAVLEQSGMNRDALEPVLTRLVDVDPGDQEARRVLNSLQAAR